MTSPGLDPIEPWPSSSRSSLEVPQRNSPKLPPRGRTPERAPPPYSPFDEERNAIISQQWRSRDPRSSSTQSLVPSESGRGGRRTLLLIYIHGFMGNETSFQSFPAHVHNLLTLTTVQTHVVHTKIYPRYNSRRAIEFARDDFSDWLGPHEGPLIDVVLLGHSMGGLLAVEVALLPPHNPATGRPFRHRILGTISFDTPFLGMHPGLVTSGIASLFRSAPVPPGAAKALQGDGASASQSQSSFRTSSEVSTSTSTQLSPSISGSSTVSTVPTNDPYYDPPFPNDIHRPQRTGLNKFLHFVNKHSDGLTSATKQYFMSHIEFGGCLADFPGLKNRYARIRALEDVDELSGRNAPGYSPPKQRVRFLNYYTASTGIPKKPKIPEGHMMDKDGQIKPIEVEMQAMSVNDHRSRSTTPNPRISVDEHDRGTVTPQQLNEDPEPSPVRRQMMNLGEASGVQEFEDGNLPEMRHIDSMPIEDDEDEPIVISKFTESLDEPEFNEPVSAEASTEALPEPPLPPIPPMPEQPQPIDLDVYTDKDDRKIAEKEQKRIMKVYQQAVKDRENAIKDRRKVVEKREKKARQEREKKLKAEEKERLKEEKEEEKRRATINPEPVMKSTSSDQAAKAKPKRDKRFCILPADVNGKRDKCWVRVYMEGVDEVGAHCGLFFPGPQYESLVGDVGARVEEWLHDDATRRAILESEGVQ